MIREFNSVGGGFIAKPKGGRWSDSQYQETIVDGGPIPNGHLHVDDEGCACVLFPAADGVFFMVLDWLEGDDDELAWIVESAKIAKSAEDAVTVKGDLEVCDAALGEPLFLLKGVEGVLEALSDGGEVGEAHGYFFRGASVES